MYRNTIKGFTAILIFLAVILLPTGAWAAGPAWMSRLGTIGNALSLKDGTQVYLDAVTVDKIRAEQSPPYFVIHECFSANDRLTVLAVPSGDLSLGQTVDVAGTLITLSDGQRAIASATVYGYLSETGDLLLHGPLIKGLIAPTPWQWKTELSATTDSKSLPDYSGVLPKENGEPNAVPSSGPIHYSSFSDLLAKSTVTDGTLAYFQCKPVVDAGNDQFGDCLVLGEDFSSDTLKVYCQDQANPGDRVNKVSGQMRFDGQAWVLCVDCGPGYDHQVYVGRASVIQGTQSSSGEIRVMFTGDPGESIPYVKTFADQTGVTISGKIVTANTTDFPGAIYVEEPDRSSGIRVQYSGTTYIPAHGDIVDVTGDMATGADGEREIDAGATGVTFVQSGTVPDPLGFVNRSLGGGDFNIYTPGVNYPTGSGVGLHNKGLLVKSWGKVTAVDALNSYFYIDDGTGFQDGSGNTGVKVSWDWPVGDKPAILPPLVGWLASVTGISSSENPSGTILTRVLRPRDQDDIVIIKSGSPATGNPAPTWAEEVIPKDSSPSGEFGPSSADSVDLATGAGENNPDPDIVIESLVGPDVEFSRRYRSTLAESGYSSPGLSPGWVHNFDIQVQGATGAWGDLTLTYPNGATEVLRPELSGGNPTGDFVAMGAPYIVTGEPGGITGQWNWLRITFEDETSWKLIAPNASLPDNYVITQVADLLGHYVSVNRVSATDMRLASITDESSNAIVNFSYSGGYLTVVSDVSVAGNPREITFSYAPEAGTTVLKSVSQANTPLALRWRYGYAGINGYPYLVSVEVPDPTGAPGLRGHSISYDTNGKVSSLVDANANRRSYAYNGDSTQVFVRDSTGKAVEFWTQKIGPKNQDLGVIDADNHAISIEYTADYKPWRVTNKNNEQTVFTYDGYGNTRTMTDPRGLVTSYNFDDPVHPFRISSTQAGTKTSTTFTYNVRGLLETVNTPWPGRPGTGDRVTTTYAYTALGNVETATTPSHGSSGTTTVFEYAADPDYGLSGVTEVLGQPLRVTVYEGSPTNNKIIGRAHFRYDSRGRLQEAIDSIVLADPNFRHRTNWVYNDADQIMEVWYAPTGSDYTKRAHHEYNYLYPGGPLQSMDLYDENGALFRHVSPTNGNESELLGQSGDMLPTNFAYDAMYRIKQLTDERSNSTHFAYSAVGNPTSLTYPSGSTMTWGFDSDHNVNQRTDGENRETNYVLDPMDSRLTDITYASGTSPSFDYDVYGRITSMTDATGTVSYTYDDNDHVLSVTTNYTGLPTPKTIQYEYYPDSSRKKMTISGFSGSRTSISYNYSYNYDTSYQGRAVHVTAPGSTLDFIYDWNGQIFRRNTGTVITTYSYDARGHLKALRNGTGSNWADSLYTNVLYDAAGNLTDCDYDIPYAWKVGGTTKRLTGHTDYTYDEMNRLTREQRTDNDTGYSYDVGFSYDAANNPESVRGTSFSHNSDNQIVGFTYDGDGNCTDFRGYGLDYDIEDLPTSITGGMSGNIATQYRIDGLRVSKTVGASTIYFLHDGDGVICEMDSAGAVKTSYGYGPTGLVQRALFTPYQFIPSYTYTFDPIGSLVKSRYYADGSTDTYGCDRTAIYDAFGKRWWDKNGWNSGYYESGANAIFVDSVGFSGQCGAFTDPETRFSETETPLVLMSIRYYDPITGRFMTRDPAGNDGNDYVYCGNNPVTRMDPLGLDWLDNAANFSAGMGDTLSFGITARVRMCIGADGVVDRSSGWFVGGAVAGIATDVATGGAVVKAGTKVAGKLAVRVLPKAGRIAGAGTKILKSNSGFVRAGKATKDLAYRFAPGKWLSHFEKHGAEFGAANSVEYLRKAQKLFKGGKGVATHVRGNGDKMFYKAATNEFGVLAKDGRTIRTFFKPDKGVQYWLKQTAR